MDIQEIRKFINAKLRTKTEIAEEMGITRSTLSLVLNGKKEPGKLVRNAMQLWVKKEQETQ